MKLITIIKILVVLIIIAIAVLVFNLINAKHPITIQKFDKLFRDDNYIVFDNYSISGDGFTSKLNSYDNFTKPTDKHTATFGGRTEVIFMVYNTEEEAVEIEKKYEESQKLKVYKQDVYNDQYMNLSEKPQHRKGDNYQRYYSKTLNEDYILISQIENTLLVAHIDKGDIANFNSLINTIGY